MNPSRRRRFDRVVERVLDELPERFRRLLDEVPLVVEDHPSRAVRSEQGLAERDELLGLYDGRGLTERDSQLPPELSEVILLYREGIWRAVEEEQGSVDDEGLYREIRVTLLHELGHHFGLDEDDLEELGYG